MSYSLLLSLALLSAPLRAEPPASLYADTANTTDPAYIKDFSLKRDVFKAATRLSRQGLKVLVAWDIDLTLGTPLSGNRRVSLASDPWWNEQVKALDAAFAEKYGPRKGPDGSPLWPAEAEALYRSRFSRLVALNGTLHAGITLLPVESFVPKAIKKAQRAGVAMMAVTARGPEMEKATLQDLRGDLGVDFSSSAPGGYGFALQGFRVGPAARPSLYRLGVLQTAGQNKGEQLLYVLKEAGYSPDIVFFVDDTEKNARDMAAALGKAGVPYRVFRYGYEDERAREYSAPGSLRPCEAQAELEAFRKTGTFPVDAEAGNAACAAPRGFELIYGSTAPADGN
ncbi:MAG: DUF2608 domain-containing protein [Elusimicrobia bacterium]|nr:DUF2608 domain-containing protein [Elusimicrobiota bacterium]